VRLLTGDEVRFAWFTLLAGRALSSVGGRVAVELPSGTVTFLFTDLEGSTRLWEEHPEAMKEALARHDDILRSEIVDHGGFVVKTTGDGFHATFATAPQALEAAIGAQLRLRAASWDAMGPLRVRMGIHTGLAELRDGDYYGSTVNRAARLMSVAHGGQILCSHACANLVRDVRPHAGSLRDLGAHRLRDLATPERVFQAIHDGLEREFPELRTASDRLGNLPTVATDFVGRDAELAELALLVEQFRLTTLAGPGGVGKTRLAVQAAAGAAASFPDGVWFVDLAPVDAPTFVVPAVATVLAVTEGGEGDANEWLARALARRRALIVLDNCEHVVDAAAEVARTVLRSCPDIVLVATSQEVLGIDGEHVFGVRPLALPEVPVSGSVVDLGRVLTSPAVRLFADRAADSRHGFEVDDSNADAVVKLCARLDGIPLALELAAARVASMSPAAMLDRLDERFRLLGQGRRTIRRHHTLRAAVDWSYGLLDRIERAVFARLSVFAGSFTLAAAESVANSDPRGEIEVLDALTSLVAKSMVMVEPGDAEDRYRLLETLRDYGRERLGELGETEERYRRHADFYRHLAEEGVPHLFGPGDSEWFVRLTDESDNLRAALTFLRDNDEGDSFERLVISLARFWYLRGWLREGVDWIVTALERASPEVASERASLAAIAASGAVNLSRWSQAQELVDLSLESSLARGEPPQPLALVARGLAALVQDQPLEARRLGDEAIAIVRESGDRFATAEILSRAALFFSLSGDDSKGADLADEAVAIADTIGNDFLASASLEAAGIARYRTDPETAVQLLDQCLGISPVRDSASGGANTHMMKAVAHLALRQHRRAAQSLLAALPIMHESDEPYYETICLGTAALLFRRTGRPDAAVRLLGAIDLLREQGIIVGATRDLESQTQLRHRLERELSRTEFTTAWTEGRSLRLADAVFATLTELEELIHQDSASAH
jgi:predicted ATPase/class 3 adenylate cyclase